MTDTCPTCLGPVRVVGRTTLRYEPITAALIEELPHGVYVLRGMPSGDAGIRFDIVDPDPEAWKRLQKIEAAALSLVQAMDSIGIGIGPVIEPPSTALKAALGYADIVPVIASGEYVLRQAMTFIKQPYWRDKFRGLFPDDALDAAPPGDVPPTDEWAWLLSQRATVQRLLDETPDGDAIDRLSWQARLATIDEEIAARQDAGREARTPLPLCCSWCFKSFPATPEQEQAVLRSGFGSVFCSPECSQNYRKQERIRQDVGREVKE